MQIRKPWPGFYFLGTCNIRLTKAAVHDTYLQIRLHKLRSVVVELADFDVLITAARRRERETVVDEREVDLLTHNVREFGQAPCLGMHHAPGAAAVTITHIHVQMLQCHKYQFLETKTKHKKPVSFLQTAENKACHPGTINSSTKARTIFWIDQNQHCHVPAPVSRLNLESLSNKPGGESRQELYTWLHERGLLPSDSTASPSLDASHFFRPALPKCLFPQPRACTSITPNHQLILSCIKTCLQRVVRFLFHFPLVLLKSRLLENCCPKLCTVDLKYSGSSSPVLPKLEKKERNPF